MKLIVAAVATLFTLGGCQTGPAGPAEPARATAALQPVSGNKTFGEASFEELGTNKLRVSIYVQGLKPGSEHALHIHEKGDCSSADGASAGGHLNPGGKPHGNYAKGEHHAGDLPSLHANKDGRAKIEAEVTGLTIAAGESSVVGGAIIVHAQPDDYKTQPAGNAGAPIACGTIRES